ncbi:MAG TPA: aminotransferase class I/II-fold pyridoxal phosphate-dependent enzyme [Gemmatimonadaceae bacterium]|nr:aminotransferase class I/II-fold pyridoxal phosphate-dependent enzyme [Gemmatimonadaceae bacterium]
MSIAPEDILICLEDHPARAPGAQPMATPIVQTSLFAYPDLDSFSEAAREEYRNTVYSRGQNPTVEVLERKLAVLERGEACKCFGSGMAAMSAVAMGLLKSGDHILFVNQTYGPMLQFANHIRRFGIEHTVLLDLEPTDVAQAMRPNTKLVWLENPGTMLMRTFDIAAVAAIAREGGALTCIDNSWATPLFQKPITHGVDIVVHSATKYIGGHSDVVAGAVITTDERMKEIFYRAYMLNGGILAPFDAWLLLRGMRTLPVRMRQHEADALRVAEYLRGRPEVREVFHPAFSPPSSALTGYSGLFSFELVDGQFENVRRFIDRLKRFRIGVSWGGVESLVIAPNRGHNLAYLNAHRIPHGLVRLSIGLEGSDVLTEDLASALSD